MPVASPAKSELFIKRLIAGTVQAIVLMQLNSFSSGTLRLSLHCVEANMLYFTHAAHSLQIGMLTCYPDHAGTCTNAT